MFDIKIVKVYYSVENNIKNVIRRLLRLIYPRILLMKRAGIKENRTFYFLFLCLAIALAGGDALAKVPATTTTIYIAPSSCSINLDLSNALPDGNVYGTVSLGLLPDACSGGYDGVQIVVDANQSIFTTILSNFGLQAFGFNYSGNPDELVITTSGNWNVKEDQNLSEFGIFIEYIYGTGSSRQDPLVVNICNPFGDLMVNDFVVPNADGYMYAAHIADFTFEGYDGVNSAWFSTTQDCSPPTTTTTVIPTTTTTVPETTTTTIPTTTTTAPTTEISLASFTAKARNAQVKLQWETETEIDNAGFNVYRSEAENGYYTRINTSLISPKGSSTQGASYAFIDSSVQNRKTYDYILEDLDLNGKSTTHGPISATPRFVLGIFNK